MVDLEVGKHCATQPSTNVKEITTRASDGFPTGLRRFGGGSESEGVGGRLPATAAATDVLVAPTTDQIHRKLTNYDIQDLE